MWLYLGIGFLLLAFYLTRLYAGRYSLRVPGPFVWPVIGSLPSIIGRSFSDPYDMMLEKTLKYGDVWVLSLPTKPWIYVVSGKEDIEYILKGNFHNYVKGERFHLILSEILGDGIFNVDGKMWLSQRRHLGKMFTTRSLKNMMPIFQRHGTYLLSHLSRNVGREVNVESLFAEITLGTICEIAFGVYLDSLGNGHTFSTAFDMAQSSADKRFGDFRWELYDTDSEINLKFAMKVVNSFIYRIVDKRLLEPSDEIRSKTDVLSLLIRKGRAENDRSLLNRRFLRDIVVNVMVAGRDTTAQLLTWMTYSVAKNDDVLNELVSTLPEDINYDTITNDSQFLDYCINESLRMYPPVPWDIKFVVNDDVLPSGYKIPAGSVVNYSPWILGRKGWTAPEVFNPWRWDPKGESVKEEPLYIPFNYGPRICLGKRLARLEAKVIMSMIISAGYRFKCTKNTSSKYARKITLSTKNGMWLRVEKAF